MTVVLKVLALIIANFQNCDRVCFLFVFFLEGAVTCSVQSDFGQQNMVTEKINKRYQSVIDFVQFYIIIQLF